MKSALWAACLSAVIGNAAAEFYQVDEDYYAFTDVDCAGYQQNGVDANLKNKCDCTSQVDGGSVRIEDGYTPGKDVLECTGCPATVTATFDAITGALLLAPAGATPLTIADVSTAIKSVTFRTSDTSGNPKAITYNYGTGIFSSKTGQSYKYFPVSLAWDAAKTACETNKQLMTSGFLTTITSADEQTAVKSVVEGTAWIGASDSTTADKWLWATGPETGTWFFQDGVGFDGQPKDGTAPYYTNWGTAQPDAGSSAIIKMDGAWESVATNPQGYVCEWGGADNEQCLVDTDMSKTIVLLAGCGHYTSAASCESLGGGRCQWEVVVTGTTSTNDPKCMPKPCQQYDSEPLCDHDVRCHWGLDKDGAGTCMDKICYSKYQSRADCSKDISCYWMTGVTLPGETNPGSVCVDVHCPYVTSRCDCTKYDKCMWNTGTGTCADKVNEACPVADIVFLLDASGSMAAKFGSHPVGYYGMIEQIRDWLQDVTLTGEASSTMKVGTASSGFRIGFISFGRPDDAIYAPSVGEPQGLSCTAAAKCVGGAGGMGANDWFQEKGGWPTDKRWKNAGSKFPVSGTTGDTAGHISGVKGELEKDLDWHENYFYYRWSKLRTILVPGMYVAKTWFENYAVPGRRHILIVLTDGALHDKDSDVLQLESDMATNSNVEIFGVVMRKGASQSSASKAAETKLKPLVSDPHDTHFLNIPLAELKSEVLDNLCNPLKGFGKNIATGSVSCDVFTGDVDCIASNNCNWNYAAMACETSACEPNCNMDICMGNGCIWNTTEASCGKVPPDTCSSRMSASMCASGNCCHWDGATCADNVCCLQKEENSCLAYGVNSPACTPSTPPVDGECAINICVWDITRTPATCTQHPCLPIMDSTKCGQNPGCQWKTDRCIEKPCTATVMGDCIADRRCEWDAFANPQCKVKYCGQYIGEAECNTDPICHADTTTSPMTCNRLPCGMKETQADCAADTNCMWMGNTGGTLPTTAAYAVAPAYCKVHACKDYNSLTPVAEAACQCNKDPKCSWNTDHCTDAQFNQCPDLDVLFLLDGSGSMKQSFGTHPHGYFALMEMLKDWMVTLPLSGDKAGQTPTGTSGGFRITFVQFSEPGSTGFKTASCAKCTNGQLSGDETQLVEDVHWHEANFIAGTTVILPALQHADNIFKVSPASRKKVMVIICDGGLKDPNMAAVDSEISKIINDDVIIFGIVIRRFPQSNPIDQQAAYMLRPLVSSPHDDFLLNIPLDDIPDKVLNHFCDPNSKLGRAVAAPVDTKNFRCAAWGFPDECNSQGECEWQQPALSGSDCASALGCPTLNCQAVPDKFSNLWNCDNCRPQRGEVQCGAQYAPAYTRVGTCGKSSCATLCNSGECATNDKCTWDATGNMCVRKVCQYSTQDKCETDPNNLCSWNGMSCEKKKCGATFIKEKCEAKAPDCAWDIGTNPPVCKEVILCKNLDQTKCNTNAQCTWDTCKTLPMGTACDIYGKPNTQSTTLCNTINGCKLQLSATNEITCQTTTDACLDKCRDATCVWPTKDTCQLDKNCVWDGRNCRDNLCQPYPNTGTCNADPKCMWKTVDPQSCIEKPCEPITIEPQCGAKPGCTWVPGGSPLCQSTFCGKFTDEMQCDNENRCTWGPNGVCVFTTCEEKYTINAPVSINAMGCNDDPDCKAETDTQGPYCKNNRCSDMADKCACEANTNCMWKDDPTKPQGGTCVQDTYLSCPDLDVLFILDGSGSMQAKFGTHPHGYYAMVEMLREWVKTLPLTGEKGGVPSTVKGGTFRLAFIQFSGKNRVSSYAKQASCANCANGQFSGDASEIDKDLEWHHNNYYKKGTMIEKSLQIAVEVFKTSPDYRADILIVITDGEIFDPMTIPVMYQSLGKEGVKTFGVVVRKGTQHTTQDLRAQATLLPLVSEPKDQHFLNIPLDDIPSSLLNDFCDPNSLFGASIQKVATTTQPKEVPCHSWSPGECLLSDKCQWTDFSTATGSVCPNTFCANLNCYERPDNIKNQYSCSECRYNMGTLECDKSYTEIPNTGFCKKSGCLCKDQAQCSSDPTCEWKGTECVTKLCNIMDKDLCTQGYNVLACQWDTMTNKCKVKDCPHIFQGNCEAAPGCFWDLNQFIPVCMPKLECSRHTGQPQCVNDVSGKCKWDTFCPASLAPCAGIPVCTDKKCVYYDQATCTADTLCRWDATAVSPATAGTTVPCVEKLCPKYVNQLDCITNPLCQWDPTNTCVDNECSTMTSEFKCAANNHCKWDPTLGACNKKYCWASYGTNQGPCNNDLRCLFVNGECTTRTCSLINQVPDAACTCRTDPNCAWDPTMNSNAGACTTTGYNSCPPLDLTIVFDGSGSMLNSFGSHPTGYEGLLTVLKDWIHDLPLTGDKASVGLATTSPGFRVSLIQFSGSYNPGQVNIDPTTNGALTGDIAEIDAAIDWHRNNPIYTRTFIQHALEQAVETFKKSPPARTDILLIFTDGKLNDPQVLQPAKNALITEGVKTFGIVVRRFKDKQQPDITAEETIKKVVSDDVNQHFLNLQLDELRDSALSTFCDANGAFGSLIVAGQSTPKDCSAIGDAGVCDMTAECEYQPRLGACMKTACDAYCTQPDCTPQTACRWNPATNRCVRKVCSHWATQDDCSVHTSCMWDTTKNPSCVPKDGSCPSQTTKAQCDALTDKCLWQPGLPAPTSAFAPFPNLDCSAIMSFTDGCSCTSVIKGSVVDIEDNYQKGADTLSCPACAGLGITATFDTKTGLLFLKGDKPMSTYAQAMSSVQFSTTSTKTTPRTITYNYGHGFYSSHTGHYYEYFPHPAGQNSISWVDSQAACAADDNKIFGLTGYLVTITSKEEQDMAGSKLGGQGWMGASDVGEEMTWKWVTGPEGCPPAASCDFTPSATGSTPQQGTGPQINGGTLFYTKAGGNQNGQYSNWDSGEPNDWRNPCSGSCKDGGEDFAHFLNTGRWNDYPLDHQSIDGYICEWGGIGKLCAAQDDLEGSIIMTPGLGICIDKPPVLVVTIAPTPAPTPVPLPPVPAVPSPCEPYMSAVDCNAFPGCVWSNNKCTAGSCSSVSTTVDCNAHPDCYWRPAGFGNAVDACTPAVDRCPELNRQDVCEGYPMCEPPINPATDDPCAIKRSLNCVWVIGAGGVGQCQDRPCGWPDQATCDAAAGCKWDTTGIPTCVVEQGCTIITDPVNCVTDAKTGFATQCVWDDDKTPACQPNVCAVHTNEATCAQDAQQRCEWKTKNGVAFCTTHVCSVYSKLTRANDTTGCLAHPDNACMVDPTTKNCIPRTCAFYNPQPNGDVSGSICACKNDPACSWDTTANECRSKHFGGCPDLDLTILFDGSGSMRKSFGVHPNGYYALLEMLRTWVKTLPLTGESYTKGAASDVRNGGFRIALVQFSPPTPVNVDTLTGGDLSGAIGEIESAIDWHEANPLFKTTYIDRGLDKAASAFLKSPTHRKKVLLIISDGRIYDVDILGPEKAKLEAEGVETFGIVIRRQAAHTSADLDAAESLGRVVSAPKDLHQLNLQMDEVADGVLLSFCEPTGPFGRLIVNPSASSCSSNLEQACGVIAACQWDPFKAVCNDHTCTKHCSQAPCVADIANKCDWNPTTKTCEGMLCSSKKTIVNCDQRPECQWDPLMKVCAPKTGCTTYDKQSVCDANAACDWVKGYIPTTNPASANTVTPFETLNCNAITSHANACNEELKGSVVSIEDGFKKGADTLACPKCASLNIQAEWHSAVGLLFLKPLGTATAKLSVFAQAMASVTFSTTDNSGAARRITYNYGHGFYSSHTGHYYEYFPHPAGQNSISWVDSQAACAADDNKILGLTGYLVTITSKEEQDMAGSKLEGQGWMGASDVGEEMTWKWVTGPEGCPPAASCDFTPSATGSTPQQGTGPQINGGTLFYTKARGTTAGQYANWDSNEPNDWRNPCSGSCKDGGEDFAHFLNTGKWNDYPLDHQSIDGYICEWGGIGTMTINPNEAHGSKDIGKITPVATGKCVPTQGCPAYNMMTTCAGDTRCKWIDPGVCVTKDYCSTLTPNGQIVCNAAGVCMWNNNKCVDKQGCDRHTTDVICNADTQPAPGCQWDYAAGKCVPATGCPAFGTPATCGGDAQCAWNAAYSTGAAVTPLADQIKPDSMAFNGCSKTDTISGSVVDIEEGYVAGADILSCDQCKPSNPTGTITADFHPKTGLLFLSGDATIEQCEGALKKTNKQERKITYNFGPAFYSSKTGHYYRHFPEADIKWGEAKDKCAANPMLGLEGYLITITSQDEQSVAETKLESPAWMGAKDVGTPAMDKEVGNGGTVVSTWRWMTGPEEGQNFWNGLGSAGRPQNGMFSNWDTNEPNDYRQPCSGSCATHGEDYGHFLWPSGRWNDYPEDHQGIKGYVCEWGGKGTLCIDPKDAHGSRTLTPSMNTTAPIAQQGLCTKKIPDGCAQYGSSILCNDAPNNKCQWDSKNNRCLDKLQGCCVDPVHGGCSDQGCCVCNEGWDTCNTMGQTAKCHLYQGTNDACDWCDPDVKCSGNGVCGADNGCICNKGWSGDSCSVSTCSPGGPQIHTAYPNTPMKDNLFKVIIHGCGFRKTDIVKVVPKGARCGEANPADGCWFDGDGMEVGEASACPQGAVMKKPMLEPNSTMELVVNLTAKWSTGEDYTEYSVCYSSDNGSNWADVKTHTETGDDMQFRRVCRTYYSCPGGMHRAAPAGGEKCTGCNIWCILAIILAVLTLCACGLFIFFAYRAANPPKNKAEDYEDFSMEQMQKEVTQKPLLKEDTLSETIQSEDRHDV